MDKHIVLISDDNYVMPTVVTIKSLCQNLICGDGDKYIVHICSFQLNDKNKKILSELNEENISIEINEVDVDKYKDKLSKINQKTHVTPTSLFKFELPNIFPDVERMLYLDSDLVIKGNIATIFDYDIEGYYLGAVEEFWRYLLAHFQYQNTENALPFYFNSGVMLLNLSRMRQENVTNMLWEEKINAYNDPNNKKVRLMDQDTLNSICANRCLRLPIRYNCDSKFTVEVNLSLLNKAFGTNYHSKKELYNNAIVLHYIGKDEKPWKILNGPRMKEWDEYYLKTVYTNEKLVRKEIKHGFSYYFPRFINSIKERGLLNSFRYVIDRYHEMKNKE